MIDWEKHQEQGGTDRLEKNARNKGVTDRGWTGEGNDRLKKH